jgi:hypothetical protein
MAEDHAGHAQVLHIGGLAGHFSRDVEALHGVPTIHARQEAWRALAVAARWNRPAAAISP